METVQIDDEYKNIHNNLTENVTTAEYGYDTKMVTPVLESRYGTHE